MSALAITALIKSYNECKLIKKSHVLVKNLKPCVVKPLKARTGRLDTLRYQVDII